MKIKTRFSPSPTGYMHLGNARTALFNALLAEHSHGCFLLRIEDTDAARSQEDYIDALQADLHWLGLVWNEGISVGGAHAPYRQSQRQAIYDQYYQQLIDNGIAYPCFCSEAELTLQRKVQLASGQAPRYPGTCRGLSAERIAAIRAEGVLPSLRFTVARGQSVVFIDRVKGEQRFASDDIGDFIIRRADGTASFMFCNAIDDAVMGVTHALRGEDHLTNTPRQLLILQALQLTPPQYAHISLLIGKDGAPLSKRNGSRSIRDLAAEGYLPLAVLNYLARLGHYYVNPALLRHAELAEAFNLEALGSASAKFDEQQLQYWQRQALLITENSALWTWMGPAVHALVPDALQAAFIDLIKPNVLFPADALAWATILFADEPVWPSDATQAVPMELISLAQATVTQHGADYAALIAALQQQLPLRGKALFQPLRLIFTGQLHGPELKQVLLLQGKTRLLLRLQQALDACAGVASAGDRTC